MYKKINSKIIKRLNEIVKGNIVSAPGKMQDYAGDEFAGSSIRKMPEVVVTPQNSNQISEILKLANQERIPVTPRGGGTGLCGGCVPLFGGIVLSLEGMNKVLEIDKKNMMAVVEAGVTLCDFYTKVEEAGLFFPPHPGEESAQFGGLVNTNASGARAVKYGGMRNYIKGLEVVLPEGEIITIGGKHMKDSTGYSLLNLMIGSEGTLGIVTKVVISLLPRPQVMYTLVVPYKNLYNAIGTVPEIHNKVVPMAVEFIEHDVIPPTEKLLGKKWPCESGAYLMIIVDGASDEEVFGTLETIGKICLKHDADIQSVDEISIADTEKRQQDVLEIRSNIYQALKKGTIEILDITVPPAEIVKYLTMVQKISKKYSTWLPTYGHAADGNVHTHIMKVRTVDEAEIEGWKDKYPVVRKELHEKAKELGGIISGEHGIGLVKMEYLPLSVDSVQIELMKGIKKLFDPNNILNPGKIFDMKCAG
ncbi:FAD-binding protein [bacterium]|nr:FAD-binding protein [bacterium]